MLYKMGGSQNKQYIQNLEKHIKTTEQQLQSVNTTLKNVQRELSEKQKIHVDMNWKEELQQKIELNQNKILEQQMKILQKTEGMTQVKDEAFKKYCALSFEQQLYSIIKYGLADIKKEEQIKLTRVFINGYQGQFQFNVGIDLLDMKYLNFNILQPPSSLSQFDQQEYYNINVQLNCNFRVQQYKNAEDFKNTEIEQILTKDMQKYLDLKLSRSQPAIQIDWKRLQVKRV